MELAEERHYTPKELADLWGFSPQQVRKLFMDEPGVLIVGGEGTLRKRAYRSLRIPVTVAVRVRNRFVVQ